MAVCAAINSERHGLLRAKNQVRQPRNVSKDAEHDQQQDQERQDAANYLSDRRRGYGGEHIKIEPHRRVDQADLHVVREDDRKVYRIDAKRLQRRSEDRQHEKKSRDYLEKTS